jgi:hypothetical protein
MPTSVPVSVWHQPRTANDPGMTIERVLVIAVLILLVLFLLARVA